METLSIGEFANHSRLSPKALRLYDQMGLLLPARADAACGYRFYGIDQLERARLVAARDGSRSHSPKLKQFSISDAKTPRSGSPTTGQWPRPNIRIGAI
jgi:hypothetical protein